MKPQTTSRRKKRRISDDLIIDTIVALCIADVEKTVRPQDIAMEIYPDGWQELLKRIKLFGGKLAKQEVIHVIRKGNIADPDDFKGVYRLKAGPNIASYEPRVLQE